MMAGGRARKLPLARLVFALALTALTAAAAIAPTARAQNTAADFSKGSIQLGYDSQTCDASLEGTIRYNSGGSFPTAPTSGLVGHWKLDEASGTLADSSGNGNDGAINGSPIYGVAGKDGNAMEFEGGVDWVQATSALTGTPATITAWVKTLDYTQNKGFAGIYDLDDTGKLYINVWNGDGTVYATHSQSGSFSEAASTLKLSNNQWYFIAGVFHDDSNRDVYVNASNKGSDTQAITAVSGIDSVRIGAKPGDGAMSGVVDDVRTYNRALTEQEITDLYNATGGGASATGLEFCDGSVWTDF